MGRELLLRLFERQTALFVSPFRPSFPARPRLREESRELDVWEQLTSSGTQPAAAGGREVEEQQRQAGNRSRKWRKKCGCWLAVVVCEVELRR